MADALTQRRRCSPHDGRKSTSNRRAPATIFRESNWPGSTRERDQFAGNIFRTNRNGSSGQSESQSNAFDAENDRRFSPPNRLCSTPCSDRDSHGVSDPSGQARGHVGRAQRGRSRHYFLPLLRHRHRQRTAKSAALSASDRAFHREVSAHERNTGGVECACCGARPTERNERASAIGGRPHF